ncbi:MAG: SIS domain-containing protein [Oscillospiraceae bacterium]|nr:SIS domain-containing protein [Oscillospiraceae bacterium]
MTHTPQRIFDTLTAERPELLPCAGDILEAFGVLSGTYRLGGKLLLCGNGGSASDCEHIVGELMKGFLYKRPQKAFCEAHPGLEDVAGLLQGALPAISLTGQPALQTAFANDVDPVMVFAQQVYGYAKPGDALLGLSTSGNAGNVIAALRVARAMGVKTIGLTGQSGGRMKAHCDVCICVPETETYRIQELHLPVYHALCAMLEAEFFTE